MELIVPIKLQINSSQGRPNDIKLIKGALDNFNLIPKFFSKKLRFLYH